MAKKYLQIQIPTPCSEDFSKMTPAEKGNFCSNCEKVVIDFSKMSDQEIANFYKNNNRKLCGRFHHSQLNRNIRLTPPKVNSIFGKAAGLILTGVLSAAATNVAAQDLEMNPPISVVETESENEKKGEEKTEPLNDKIIKFKIIENTHSGKRKNVVKGAMITYLGTRSGCATNELGIAEIPIPEFCFKEEKFVFSIDHFAYKSKVIKLDAQKINENSFLDLELEVKPQENFHFLGDVSYTEIDLSLRARDFPFEIEELDVKESIQESQISKDSDSREEEDLILPPLGVAIKKVYPNPFIDRINIEVSTERKGLIQINLIDISGRTVFQKVEQAEIGTQQFQIEVGNLSLSGNMYILQVQDESGNIQTQQLMRFTNQGFTMR